MHTVPLGPKRTRVSLVLGLVLAVVMIVIGVFALAVAGPPLFAWFMLIVGIAIGAVAVVRLVMLRRT